MSTDLFLQKAQNYLAKEIYFIQEELVVHLFTCMMYIMKQTANETVVKNPTESKLINATKISGRTQSGLGIGFLNAITTAQYATIENTSTKEQRKITYRSAYQL